MHTVIYNLYGNAVKFTMEGRVDMYVTLTDSTLKMAVKDTGPGIPADQIGNLFQVFTQVHLS